MIKRLFHQGFREDTAEEIRASQWERLWVRGGFPLSFLARSEAASLEWRRALVCDFLERDLPGLGFRAAPETMRRFWTMIAHYHGQIWNASEFARAFGIADTTVRRHLDRCYSIRRGTQVFGRYDADGQPIEPRRPVEAAGPVENRKRTRFPTRTLDAGKRRRRPQLPQAPSQANP